MDNGRYSFKAAIPEVGIPQEKFTGDVLKGRGPRRGNLERLLRYWRPIMRKPGGFRRCRVILADHPELYPLNNICAWLHHETTGLWPNEGCHHPTMKNCRRKLKKGVNGSLWSNEQFNNRLSRIPKAGEKSLQGEVFFDTDWYTKGLSIYQENENYVVTPRIMKRTLSVPGAVTIIAALIGSSLLGLVGGLLAVPVAASIILILDEVVIPRANKA